MSEEGESGVPIGVKLISILSYLSGGAKILIGGAIAILGAAATSLVSIFFPIGSGPPSVAMVIVMGFLIVFLGSLEIAIGYGLWTNRNWARITAITVASLLAVISLISFPMGMSSSVIGLIVSGLIIWYLGFNQEARNAFL